MAYKVGTLPDLGIEDFGERLNEYKEFIKESISLYDRHSVYETNEDKIYHNTIIYCAVKNAIFTVIQRLLKDYCEEMMPRMVSFLDKETMIFWKKFLTPTNDEDVQMMFDISRDVVSSLT
jgi:hypothetical protein